MIFMQIDEVRRRELVEFVFFMIGTSASGQVLQLLVGLEAVSRMPPSLNGFQTAEWVVDHALGQESPDVFFHVVRTVDQSGALADVHRLVADIEADRSRWTSTSGLGGLWAPPEWPFVDRESLRTILNTMADGSGPSTLSIDGSLGHGKRTITSYIRQLAEKKRSFRTVVAELRREPGGGALMAVVADLRLKLELDLDLRTTHAEPERQGEVLARDVALEALSAPVPVWFIANVIEPAGVDPGTMRFVDELVRLAGIVPELRTKLRVVLLSESVSLLGLSNPPPVEDRHTLPEIDRQAVTQWLAAAVPGKDEALYDLTTDVVFRKIEDIKPPPADRLRTLAFHCANAHRKLSGVGTG
jgi:hypothetical protein